MKAATAARSRQLPLPLWEKAGVRGLRFDCSSHLSPRGFTLIEVLIALLCIVLLMLAYTQLFSDVSGRISDARSMIELEHRMQSAEQRLRSDLSSTTCDMLPWQNPADGQGYFEYIEGPIRDRNLAISDDPSTGTAKDSIDESLFLGDVDDVLMFTIRSKGVPFTGRYTPVSSGATITVQSQVAEVVWFLRPTLLPDGKTRVSPPTFTLYRRAFLVMPTYQGNPTFDTINSNPSNGVTAGYSPSTTGGLLMPLDKFYAGNDISAHVELNANRTNPVLIANTLGDLTKRECRYGHTRIDNGTAASAPTSIGFPHRVLPSYLVPFGGTLNSATATSSSPAYQVNPANNSRFGEDVVLTNVVAFDVQAWDPTAPVYNISSNTASAATAPQISVAPGDPGFPYPPTSTLAQLAGSTTTPTPTSVGAYVDLNWLSIAWNGSTIPVPWNVSTVGGPTYMSPFYSTGAPKSQLASYALPALLTNLPADFYTNNWMFDDTDANNLLNYKYPPATFDTWSVHYEYDGLDQDQNGIVDQAADNINNIAAQRANGTLPTAETSPPYPVPLRGIKVRIRCYEPDSRLFHETSVIESFVPE